MDLYDFLWTQYLSDPVVCVRCSCLRWITYYNSIFQTGSRSTSGHCILKNENNGRRCVKAHVLCRDIASLRHKLGHVVVQHCQQCGVVWPSESESGGDRQFAASFTWEFFIHSRVKCTHTGIPYRTLLSISVRLPFMENCLNKYYYIFIIPN